MWFESDEESHLTLWEYPLNMNEFFYVYGVAMCVCVCMFVREYAVYTELHCKPSKQDRIFDEKECLHYKSYGLNAIKFVLGLQRFIRSF